MTRKPIKNGIHMKKKQMKTAPKYKKKINYNSLNILIPDDLMEEIKIRTIINKSNITQEVTRALKRALRNPCDKEIEIRKRVKEQKHQIYRLKYDSHEKDK